MSKIKTKKYLAAALMLGALGTYGVAQANPCTVNLNSTSPDGTLTHATHCSVASSNSSDSTATTLSGILADNPGGLGGLTWTHIDRDFEDNGSQTENGFAITGEETGTWLINKHATNLSGRNKFIVTLKGGDPLDDSNSFLWFLIDTTVGVNTCTNSQAAAGWDLCGTWQMYGEADSNNSNNHRKDMKHMDLFAATQGGGNTIPQAIPEPSTLLLGGVGLLGLALGRKRVVKSQA